MQNAKDTPNLRAFIGIFLFSFSLLFYQILLTRIFSVITWYHFAFVAISITMFGLTLGSLAVFLFPGFYHRKFLSPNLFYHGFILGLSLILSLVYLSLFEKLFGNPFQGFARIAITFLITSIPFILGGVCVSLLLLNAAVNTGKMYAADLCGASLACLSILFVLKVIDAPNAVLLCGGLISLSSALLFDPGAKRKIVKYSCLVSTLCLLSFVFFNTVFTDTALLNIVTFNSDVDRQTPLFDKWNSFSRVRVFGDQAGLSIPPFGWGLSSAMPANLSAHELHLLIDGIAGTVITGFNGDLRQLEHLKYDVTNVVQYLRGNADVFVVGVGGGRDILSALAFKQKSVTGAEINDSIIQAVNGKFGDFSGHLDSYPQVHLINDEARSYLARGKNRYDIIMISLVDTFAATSAGAFALTENALYTTEGFLTFLSSLNDHGVLSVSRWYSGDHPFEIYRLMTLATSALTKIGIHETAWHLLVVKKEKDPNSNSFSGIATMLVSKEEFSQADLERIKEISDKMGFEIIFGPGLAKDKLFTELTSPAPLQKFSGQDQTWLSAPTDDRPFFFQFEGWKEILNNGVNSGPLGLLFSFLLISSGLAVVFIIFPLWFRLRDLSLCFVGSPLTFYFFAIGMGYLLIEMSLIQWLSIFLGHPTYALSITLFTLLLSSAAGSRSANRFKVKELLTKSGAGFALLLVTLLAFGFITPLVLHFAFMSLPLRILCAVTILAPSGYLMGMMLPIGLEVAAHIDERIKPWLWGVNGASSVIASVLAVVISITSGISYAYWLGCAFYLLAVLAFLAQGLRKASPIPLH